MAKRKRTITPNPTTVTDPVELAQRKAPRGLVAYYRGNGPSGVTINGSEVCDPGYCVAGPRSLIATLLDLDDWEAGEASGVASHTPTAASGRSKEREPEGTPTSSPGAADHSNSEE